jgi:hypothetical protein
VFLSGQAVSLLGDGLAVLAIPVLVLDLTRSPLISGLSAASMTPGYLAVGLPAGVLAGSLTAALGGNPRPVFPGAGAIVAATAAAGWGAGLRRAGPAGAPS